jgi:ribosomal protein L35
MPKMKTNKTLKDRIKVSKNGKIRKLKNNNRHLKRKDSTNTKFRKAGFELIESKGYKKMFKRLLGKYGKDI